MFQKGKSCSFICVIWLIHVSRFIHMCDMTPRYMQLDICIIHAFLFVHTSSNRSSMRHDSSLHVTWLIRMCDKMHSHVQHDSPACVRRLNDMCDMTHSYICHDPFICMPQLMRTSVWNISQLWQRIGEACATSFIHMWDMTHSFICETWLIHICDMSYAYVRHDALVWNWSECTREVCLTHTYIHTEYIYAYIHTHIHTYLHTHIQNKPTFIHTYMHTYIHAYLHIYIHVYIHTYRNIREYMCCHRLRAYGSGTGWYVFVQAFINTPVSNSKSGCVSFQCWNQTNPRSGVATKCRLDECLWLFSTRILLV